MKTTATTGRASLSQAIQEQQRSEVLLIEKLRQECARKDELIKSLRKKLEEADERINKCDLRRLDCIHCDRRHCRTLEPAESLDKETTTDGEHLRPQSSGKHQAESTVESSRPPFCPENALQEIQRWMFTEGGHLLGVNEMIPHYSVRLRELGLPLDRLFTSGVMLHPRASAYIWKWRATNPQLVEGHEMPAEVFERKKELLSPDEPFTVLFERRADSVRMRRSDAKIPTDCQWFIEEGYVDYLALPFIYKGEMKGGIAFATKDPAGFSDDNIDLLKNSLAALSTVMRLHTNDLVMTTIMDKLEIEVAERTKELAMANKSLEAANNRMIEQAENQLKHFAMMSHEIRTPLNCVVGMASLLLNDPEMDSAKRRDSIEMIVRSGDLLSAVVDDVLSYAKLESGSLELEYRPFNLCSTVRTAVTAMETKALERNVEVRACTADDIPKVIVSDERRLSQILYNLLGNAVKFSKVGGVVDLKVSRDGQDIVLEVKDYGRGIEKRDLQTIFEPFNQGNRETLSRYGGTGLGLAITRKLVNGLDGTIGASSEFGSWSLFVVRLPLVAGKSAETRSEVSDAPTSPTSSAGYDSVSSAESLAFSSITSQGTESYSRKFTVLVAEDNAVNQKILLRMLEKISSVGHVDVVDNGLDAVNHEKRKQYDVILMDMQMPLMDGLQATKEITSRSRNGTPPKVVFVTAHALDTFRQQALEAGAAGFLSKPFDLQKIESVFEADQL